MTAHQIQPIRQSIRLALIDNADSFTYNVYQYLLTAGASVDVFSAPQAKDLSEQKPSIWQAFQGLILSPGPGHPNQATDCLAVLKSIPPTLPILGVCLGHQIIAHHFGANVDHAPRVMHGKVSTLAHDGLGLYEGLPQHSQVARYHSLIVQQETLPTCFKVSSWSVTKDGTHEIMGLRHTSRPIETAQFHPEAILSEHGPQMISNFVDSCTGLKRAFA